ncbi:Protein MAIN-LIKE 1 [Glycine soja]
MVKTKGLGRALCRVGARGLGRGRDRDDTDSAEAEAIAAGDEPMVDAAAQDTGAETDAQDTDAETDGDEPMGFPGGPRDPSVLTEYADHVAGSVWSGQERPELKLCSHGRKVHNLGRPIPAIEDMVARTGLSPLIACSIDIGDRGFISSFVERWHRETSSFHLPKGEVSITLDDVVSLLHWPIIGTFHDFQPLRTDEAVVLLVELLMVSAEVSMAEDKPMWWTILAESNVDLDYDEVSPCVCRWIVTKKTVKKLGYVQCIPAHPVHSWVSYDDVDDTWTHYSDHLEAAGDLCVVPTLASTHADPDANEPRHAVEACHAIAEALEQHLNAPGTSTHEEVI